MDLKLFLDPFGKRLISEGSKDFQELKIQTIVAIDDNSELLKTEIISHIRAIKGITRVDIHETYFRSNYYMTRLTVKIDLNPFGMTSTVDVLKIIKIQCQRIDGVRRFSYISKAEMLN